MPTQIIGATKNIKTVLCVLLAITLFVIIFDVSGLVLPVRKVWKGGLDVVEDSSQYKTSKGSSDELTTTSLDTWEPNRYDWRNCDHPIPIRQVVVRGERHHGTHWVEMILKKNMKYRSGALWPEQKNGEWKHGFLDGYNFKFSKTQLLIILTRDIFAWLPKMYKDAYCHGESSMAIQKRMQNNRTLPFSAFIRAHYNCEAAFGQLDREARNIIALRTAKYKSWLTPNPDYFNYLPPYCTRVHFQYESIVKDEKGTIGVMLQKYGIGKSKTSFQEVKGYTKWGRTFQGPFVAKGVKEQQKIENLREFNYTIPDLKFILENLDLDFEEALGYNYDYVREYITNNEGG